MKKLYIVALATFTGLNVYASQYANESIEAKVTRHEGRTDTELEKNYTRKQERFGEEFQEQSPEQRLILKAIEYRVKFENGEMNEHHFNKIMQSKKRTFKYNLNKKERAFGKSEAEFFNKCKTASSAELKELQNTLTFNDL